MEKLMEMLFGSYDIWDLLGYSIFFVLGMFLYSYLEVENRNVQSTNTPKEWSWKFWVMDNWRRYIGSVVLIYIIFRFFIELTGNELSEFTALMMGFTGDGIVGMKKKSIKTLHRSRDKFLKDTMGEEALDK